jgi:hypothetical protein
MSAPPETGKAPPTLIGSASQKSLSGFGGPLNQTNSETQADAQDYLLGFAFGLYLGVMAALIVWGLCI